MIDTPELPTNPRAEDHLERLRKISLLIFVMLNTHRRLMRIVIGFPPFLAMGDRVWLLRHHIKTTRPCDKLNYRRLGPFRITGKVNDVTFRLDLPPRLHIHSVFHSSLLEC